MCGIDAILFRTIVLGNLYDFPLESSLTEFSRCLEILKYQGDRFAKIKATDEVFMNQYLE